MVSKIGSGKVWSNIATSLVKARQDHREVARDRPKKVSLCCRPGPPWMLCGLRPHLAQLEPKSGQSMPSPIKTGPGSAEHGCSPELTIDRSIFSSFDRSKLKCVQDRTASICAGLLPER